MYAKQHCTTEGVWAMVQYLNAELKRIFKAVVYNF